MGFLFLVLYPLRPPPVLPSTHSLTHLLTHSLTPHSLTHPLPPSLPRSLPPSLTHSLTHRRFCVASVGQCALPRGRMYALASLGAPPLLRGRRGTMCAAFAWQAWDNVHCQGVGCTPWRPLGLRLFCVAGVAQLTCGVFVFSSVSAPSSSRPPVHSLTQSLARSLTHSLTPHSPTHSLTPPPSLAPSPPLVRGRRFCVAGVGQCALPRGRMYALASLLPLLRGRRGTMCTAKGSDVRPGVPWGSASFAWQACADVRPGVPWGSAAFAWQACDSLTPSLTPSLPHSLIHSSPPLLRGRHGTMCAAKGSDVNPGVPWGSAAFAWQAWDNVHCQGVGCTPWRPLGLRLFCVAGVAQCALPRGRMYALASLGSPPLLRGRRGTMCTTKGSDALLRGRRGTIDVWVFCF